MKIKLVTFAPHPNFGTCLQSYALNKVLCDMGHEVEFIYNGRENPPKTLLRHIKNFIRFFLPSSTVRKIHKRISIRRESMPLAPPAILKLPDSNLHYYISRLPFYNAIYKLLMCRTLQQKKVWRFTFEDGNYQMKRLYCKSQYDEIVADADLFITGSDQIWNPYCGGFNPMMFLEFAGEKKRIAYSSSIARLEFPIEVRERARMDLMKFQHIAVREKSSVDLLNKLLDRNDIQLVLDPTYLLSREEWQEFGNRATIEFEVPERYIFCYFVGDRYEDYDAMVRDVMYKTGIKDVVTVDCTGSPMNYGDGIIYRDGGPYEWVYLLSHSSLVCMDSFHATVFALGFHKDFVHILKTKGDKSTASQNSRMYDMLGRYGLKYKLYEKTSKEWLKPIDYINIDRAISEEVNSSLGILKMEISCSDGSTNT